MTHDIAPPVPLQDLTTALARLPKPQTKTSRKITPSRPLHASDDGTPTVPTG